MNMQQIATKIFVYASVVFGITGIIIVFTAGPGRDDSAEPNAVLMKILFTCVFVILTSFALSIAGKYLNGKSH